MNAATTDTRHSRAVPLRLLLILGAISTIGPLSIDMCLSSLPRPTRDLSTSASLVQATLTACLVGLAVGQVPAGPLSDMWGRRWSRSPSTVEALIAFRLVQGAAGAAAS